MSTITKEQLRERALQKVKSLELAVTQTAFADSRAELEEELELARIALASLEAEPVAYIGERMLEDLIDGARSCGRIWPEVTDKMSGEDRIPLFAAPPAPVSVPDNVSGPLAHAYKELTPTFMRNHIGVFERYGIYPDGSAGIQAMRIALDGMNRRAAMLQGADGNSPGIPDGWMMVPAEPTAEMISSGIAAHFERSQMKIHDRPAPGPMECAYVAMLSAAPQQEVK